MQYFFSFFFVTAKVDESCNIDLTNLESNSSTAEKAWRDG